MATRYFRFLVVTVVLTSSLFAQTATPSPKPKTPVARPATAPAARLYDRRLRFQITISTDATDLPVSGRLLVLMSRSAPSHEYLEPPYGQETESVWIAARDIPTTRPRGTLELDPDQIAFPTPFSKAPAGDYWIMAMLDHDNDAAYRFLTPGDLVMKPIKISALRPAIAGTVKLTINQRILDKPAPQARDGVEALDFVSPSLTAFWGREIHMGGWIVFPPSYRKNNDHYPVVYWTHGFGARLDDLLHVADKIRDKTSARKYPEMIWVVLDESLPSGTHEFADSLNNGPWGKALTEELIPFLESRYRMDGLASGRFLTGHSSGGWATMWLQVRYPTMFGGTWSTSPDPTDFHKFTGPDLVSSPLQNFYRDPSGHPWPLVRMENENVETLEEYARQEAVVGPVGGQMSSFEWVFSPRCPDGRPCQLFDRVTGEVHPEVAKYWEEHYDIAHLVQTRWAEIGPNLKGKIHLIIGTWDTFHLDEPARKLQAVLDALGADAHFTFIPGRDHFDLYEPGLDEQIAREMYEVARPGSLAGSGQK
jgi:S-formylglutathione hydrolase FrmB